MSGKRGLFDGFEAQRTPTDSDYTSVLRTGMVALDTNVLLDLYRMNGQVRMDMLTVLKSIKERIWVPHQVVMEFWRGRQSEELISYHDRKADTTKEALRAASDKAKRALDDWVKSVHIGDKVDIAEPMYKELDQVQEIFEKIGSLLEGQANRDRVPGIRDTNTDPVISELEKLLDGKVGLPNDDDRNAKEISIAKERAKKQMPPGYLDFESGKKSDKDAAGDYLLWRQILDQAQEQNIDVLLVTRDLKEDWWRKAPPKAVRLPRIELVREFRDVAGGRFFMVEPSVLMQKVSTVFKLERKVNQNSVAALQSFESTENSDSDTASSENGSRYRLAQVPGGRSTDYVDALWSMTRLVDENTTMDECIAAFMEEFPSVTLAPEARRRLLVLASLGLATVSGQHISLTRSGEKFLENRDSELLYRLFMERIDGAFEARNAILGGADISELKDMLISHHGLDLSQTQVELLLRWMGKLGLLKR
ncbi:PIN domain-containing protein [Nocardiopsis dassonvillei]|uniref:PIN domain-containing protein n=1 Tax=Nocardiopsis dassonvillei TaxID=2014 RepID=UPI003F56D009